MRAFKIRSMLSVLFLATCLMAGYLVISAGLIAEADDLSGVKTAKVVFDFRIGQPANAAAHLTLVHNTFKELRDAGKDPDAAVVFIGPSVKLISTSRNGFTEDDNKSLDEIARTINAMMKDGMRFEICIVAAKVFKVDPVTILPGIEHVQNGWVSLTGLQNRGYALIPAY